MASINSYRNKWLRWHKSYEKRAYKELKKTFSKWNNAIDFNSMTETNYTNVIENAIDDDALLKTLENIYIEVGLTHGSRVGAGVNKELKLFTLGEFTTVFLNSIIEYLLEYGAEKVVIISRTYKDDIAKIISKGLEDQKTMPEIAKELQKMVSRPGFYRWQAMRIARTETTAAANRAALEAGAISGFVTNKVWLSSQDKRTRDIPKNEFDHLDMDEVQVNIEDDFKVPRKDAPPQAMAYPGDPRGSAGNVINCRCAVAIVPARDRFGNLIPTT